jgi:hypothetical protein
LAGPVAGRVAAVTVGKRTNVDTDLALGSAELAANPEPLSQLLVLLYEQHVATRLGELRAYPDPWPTSAGQRRLDRRLLTAEHADLEFLLS